MLPPLSPAALRAALICVPVGAVMWGLLVWAILELVS